MWLLCIQVALKGIQETSILYSYNSAMLSIILGAIAFSLFFFRVFPDGLEL